MGTVGKFDTAAISDGFEIKLSQRFMDAIIWS
jgi:hypothetical protein